MGKGDKRSKRGKIFAGSFGNTRPKPKNNRKHKAPKEGAVEETVKKTPAKKVKKVTKSDG